MTRTLPMTTRVGARSSGTPPWCSSISAPQRTSGSREAEGSIATSGPASVETPASELPSKHGWSGKLLPEALRVSLAANPLRRPGGWSRQRRHPRRSARRSIQSANPAQVPATKSSPNDARGLARTSPRIRCRASTTQGAVHVRARRLPGVSGTGLMASELIEPAVDLLPHVLYVGRALEDMPFARMRRSWCLRLAAGFNQCP